MRPVFLSLLVMLLAAPAPTGAAPSPEKREVSPFPILDRDPALRKKLTLDRPPENIGQLLRTIAKQTGTQVLCQGDFLKKTVTVSVKDQEAREVLTQIAMTARGVWMKRNGVYRMMQDGMSLGVFQVGGSPVRAMEAAVALQRSLTKHQREWLMKQPLPWKLMTPAQKQFANIAYWQYYVEHPELHTQDMVADMDRLEIRILPSSSGPAMMYLMGPKLDDKGNEVMGAYHISELR
jgi:type II secretory pathway component GspD/PulD (secretin)